MTARATLTTTTTMTALMTGGTTAHCVESSAT
jgi:hypothetical protein